MSAQSPDQIHDVCRDQRKHDGNRHIHRLQIAAKRKVSQQRQRSPIERAQERTHRYHQFRTDAECRHHGGPERHREHQYRREDDRQKQSVGERMTRIFEIFAPIRMGNEGVEPSSNPPPNIAML